MTQRLIFFIVAALSAQTGYTQAFSYQKIITTQADNPYCVHAADLDGDGDIDVLSASSLAGVDWYENYGEGHFGPPQPISAPTDRPNNVLAADLDEDGDMDVLSDSHENQSISWYENLGEGEFGSEQIITPLAGVIEDLDAEDLDGDGDLDVLSASIGNGEYAWYENLGGGNFGSQEVLSLQAGMNIIAADLDGDGDLDVLGGPYINSELVWFENLAPQIFSLAQMISTEIADGGPLEAADLDGSGDMDAIAVANHQSPFNILWFPNLADGIINDGQIIATSDIFITDIHAADLDGDDDMDLMFSTLANEVFWYENLGAGIFGPEQIITTEALNTRSVHAADLDNDGDLDALSATLASDKIAWYENLSIMAGCLDTNACNYDSDALLDDGSCCYTNCGCTNPMAVNYSETATCDNDSCEFLITGTVFFDAFGNGLMSETEYGLQYETVVNQQTGETYTTNEEGVFVAILNQSEFVELYLQPNTIFEINTTPDSVTTNGENAMHSQPMFGVRSLIPSYSVYIDLFASADGFLCNEYNVHNIVFRNGSNMPIDGIIELEYDELFQGHQEITPILTQNGNNVFLSFENLLPGQQAIYDVSLLTPTSDFIGEFVTSYARIYATVEGVQVAFGERELISEVTCAYDPNDKQAFPAGYTDEHLLLQQTEQEFLIRFQNTGNAPAQNVRILDTLDVNFDVASFRLLANSHSVMTTINPETHLVDFYFENIQLPDSVNNEPESHGFITYAVTPNPDLPVGTVLENTAYIYFDNNEPIITNTTWTTIHECGGEAAFEPVAVLICDEPQVNFESSYDLVEQYSWHVDGVGAGANSELLLSSINNPEYEVTLTASNPLCTETNTLTYQVPDISSIDPCLADLNCDGYRSTQDLLVMISEFGCVSDCQADLDNNDIVNVIDLVIFVSLFELSCWE